MNWKNLGKALLFPHIILLFLLLPISAVLLIYAMTSPESASPIAIASYVLSAYTLTIWCARVPELYRRLQAFRRENKYARIWQTNTRLRVNITLYSSFLWNAAYAVFQFGLGVIHHSTWFYAMAAYYLVLAVMRCSLANFIRKHKPGEQLKEELKRYRACGILFLLLNIALAVMVFFLLYWNKTFYHHEITTIAMAAYTFGSLTLAIVNVIKYRKYCNPVYSAAKAINLTAACVSMLTLESTMLTTFSDATFSLTDRRIMLGISGIAVSAFVIVIAVYMILHSTRGLRALAQERKEPNRTHGK